MWKKNILDNRSRKKGRIERLCKKNNLNFKRLALCTSSPNKKLDLSISAETGEEIRREAELT